MTCLISGEAIDLLPKNRKFAQIFQNDKKAFFSISLDHSAPAPNLIEAGIDFLCDHITEVGFLIGDSLFAKTLVMQKGLSLMEAAAEAEKLTSDLISQVKTIKDGYCSVLRSESLLSTSQARQARKRFEQFFQENNVFATAIKTTAEQFCQRQARHGRLALPLSQAIALSCDYLIDEVVMYELLAQDGWLIEAHIGKELEVLQLFMDGAFTGISPALEKRKYIELKIKRLKTQENS